MSTHKDFPVACKHCTDDIVLLDFPLACKGQDVRKSALYATLPTGMKENTLYDEYNAPSLILSTLVHSRFLYDF